MSKERFDGSSLKSQPIDKASFTSKNSIANNASKIKSFELSFNLISFYQMAFVSACNILSVYNNQQIDNDSFLDALKIRFENKFNFSSEEAVLLFIAAAKQNDSSLTSFLLKSANLSENALAEIARWAMENNSLLYTQIKENFLNIPTVSYEDSVTELMKACQEGDFMTVTKLMLKGVNVNAKDKFSNSALHYAAQNLKADVVKILLTDRSIEANLVNQEGDTPLRMALKKGFEQANANFDGETSSLKNMEAFANARSVISILQEKAGVDFSFGTENKFFVSVPFREILAKQSKKYLRSSAITWTISILLPIVCFVAPYCLPFYVLTTVCSIAVAYASDFILTAKAFNDARDPFNVMISSGLSTIAEDHLKINLNQKFMVGEYKLSTFGEVITADAYKDELKKNSAYKNQDKAYYAAKDLPKNKDGTLKLTGDEQKALNERVFIAFAKAKNNFENTVLSNTKEGLQAIITEMKEISNQVTLGIKFGGSLDQMIAKTFAQENIAGLARDINNNSQFQKTFEMLYLACKKGAVKVDLETLFFMEKVRAGLIVPQALSIFSERLEPTLTAHEFFAACSNFEVNTPAGVLSFTNTLMFAEMVHANTIASLNDSNDKSLVEKIAGVINVLPSAAKEIVSIGINAAALATDIENEKLVESVSKVGGVLAGVVNAKMVYAGNQLGFKEKAAVVTCLWTVDGLWNHYEQTKSVLENAAKGSVTFGFGIFRSTKIKAVIQVGQDLSKEIYDAMVRWTSEKFMNINEQIEGGYENVHYALDVSASTTLNIAGAISASVKTAMENVKQDAVTALSGSPKTQVDEPLWVQHLNTVKKNSLAVAGIAA